MEAEAATAPTIAKVKFVFGNEPKLQVRFAGEKRLYAWKVRPEGSAERSKTIQYERFGGPGGYPLCGLKQKEKGRALTEKLFGLLVYLALDRERTSKLEPNAEARYIAPRGMSHDLKAMFGASNAVGQFIATQFERKGPRESALVWFDPGCDLKRAPICFNWRATVDIDQDEAAVWLPNTVHEGGAADGQPPSTPGHR